MDLVLDWGWGDESDEPDEPDRRRVREHLERCLAELDVRAGTLGIRAVGAAEMAALHERYSGVPGPTDVLTFDNSEQHGDGLIDGDIVVCRDVAAEAAAAAGHPVRAELLLYLLHGVLHLLGEDDRDADAFARMHAREDAVLTAVGVGPLFDRERRPAAGGGAR